MRVASPLRTCEFLILSEELSPQDLNVLLGIQADEAFTRGDFIVGVYRTKIATAHSWAIRADGDDAVWLNSLIEDVIDRLRPAEDNLRALAAAGQIKASFHLYQAQHGRERVGPGFSLSEEVVSWAAAVGAFFDIDLYTVDPPDDSASHGTPCG